MSDWLQASCHCGGVEFQVQLSEGMAARRCDCSFCRMRGAVTVSTTLEGLRLVSGAENLTLYQFNSKTAAHYFCKVCGIYTHHQRRSNPQQFGVNVACLAGKSPFDFAEVPVVDGVNHPSDGGPARIAGVLRYSET